MSGLSSLAGLLQAAGPYLQAATYATGLASSAFGISSGIQAKKAGEELADEYEEAGRLEQQALRIEAARRKGKAIASTAAGGIDPKRGTPALIIAENAYFDDLNQQMASYNAGLKAQRARLDGEAFATGSILQSGSTLVDLATRGISQLGPKPPPITAGTTRPVSAGRITSIQSTSTPGGLRYP